MTYDKTVWEDEILAGAERYDIKENDGTPISSNVQIVLATEVTVAGTAVNAENMNNIENGVETLDDNVEAPIAAPTATDDFLLGAEVTSVWRWVRKTLAEVKTILFVSPTFTGNTTLRIAPRIGTVTTSATPTPNADTQDQYNVTALAEPCTFGAPTGTPVNGQKLIIRIKPDATPRVIGWNAIYDERGAVLPIITVANKYIYVGLIYNAAATTWDCLAVAEEL